MSMVETVVIRDPWDVDRRLAELHLTREGLLKVRSMAISAAADATDYHPANAAGTLAYQHGTFALRSEFVGEVWQLERLDGVETIRNDKTKVRVAFANVDVACSDSLKPKPRSRKGAGAERACQGNLFGNLPEYAPRQSTEWATYYVMTDEKGAAELTRPIVENNTFTAYVERIYLSDGSDMTLDPAVVDDDGDAAADFDPEVVRK
jgi:hypothetical protein